MYKLFFGTDQEGVRGLAQKEIDTLKQKGATINRIDADNFEAGMIADALGSTSLFGGEEVYVVDTPSGNSELQVEFEDSLEAMAESTNIFIVIEEGLLAGLKKKYEKHAAASQESKLAKKEYTLNPFALADALANKDKRRLWLLLQEMKTNGLPAEELIGILWWQLKVLRLAAMTNSAVEAGMKDFPYNKAKRALVKFSGDDLEKYSTSLLTLYHEGHLSQVDIDQALEQWVLGL